MFIFVTIGPKPFGVLKLQLNSAAVFFAGGRDSHYRAKTLRGTETVSQISQHLRSIHRHYRAKTLRGTETVGTGLRLTTDSSSPSHYRAKTLRGTETVNHTVFVWHVCLTRWSLSGKNPSGY